MASWPHINNNYLRHEVYESLILFACAIYLKREREREREREKKFAMPWHHHLLNIWGMIESVIASPCDCTLDLLYLLWWLKPNLKQISYMVHGRLRSTQWLKLRIVVFMTTKKGSWRLQHNLDLKVSLQNFKVINNYAINQLFQFTFL